MYKISKNIISYILISFLNSFSFFSTYIIFPTQLIKIIILYEFNSSIYRFIHSQQFFRFHVSAMWRSPPGIFSRKMIRALVLLCMVVLPLVRCHKVRVLSSTIGINKDNVLFRANVSLKQRTRVYVGRGVDSKWQDYSRNRTKLIVDPTLITRPIHAA